MKRIIFLSAMALAIIVSAFGQNTTFELTFTAIDSAAYVRPDSIKVMNKTLAGSSFPVTKELELSPLTGLQRSNILNSGGSMNPGSILSR